VLDVPGGETCVAGEHYSRDLRITYVHRTAGTLSFRREQSGRLGRGSVEFQHPSLQIVSQQLVERRFETLSALALRQQSETETRFEKSNARDPY
jgi:hypothetical protein